MELLITKSGMCIYICELFTGMAHTFYFFASSQ